MVITDSYHNDIEGKDYKYGSPTMIDNKSKPIILYYFLDDYERVWDEGKPISYDDEELKNNASVSLIDYTDNVLLINLFDYESFDEMELKFQVGKETSIPDVVDENNHSKEYRFTPTKIVVANSLGKDSAVYDEIVTSVWDGYYKTASKEGEKLPKVAENVKNAESYKKCAECSDSVFGLEEEICFECSSFGAESEDCEVCYTTVDKGTLNDVQAGRICNECHKMNQYTGGTRTIKTPYNAETFDAQGKPTWAGYCPFCKKWRTTEWSKQDGKDRLCGKRVPDYHTEAGEWAYFYREKFARHGGNWAEPNENICGVVLEKKQSKNAETFEANAKTGNKVYIITRRCEDYSAYRELDVAGYGSLTEARKKFNLLFKEEKEQNYPNETIAYAKDEFGWGDYWGVMSFQCDDMIYELREVIVGDRGGFYFDAETFEARENKDGTIVLTDNEWNACIHLYNGNYLWGNGLELKLIDDGLKNSAKFKKETIHGYEALRMIHLYERLLRKRKVVNAETFESESDCREAKEEVKKLRRKIALLDKLYDKENALHHEILGSGGFFKEHELKGLFSEKDLENYEYWS
jgi:hypothetical protein